MSEHTVQIARADDFRDVRAEKEFPFLNRNGFVRGVSPMDQWLLLVNETWAKLRYPMNEPVRDYITCMLERFMTRVNLLEQLTTFEYVPFLIGEKRIDDACIQDVADMSLQYVALFPECSDYRHEMRSVDYVAVMGETLYGVLSRKSEKKNDWFSNAYRAMAKDFALAVMVLSAMNSHMQSRRGNTHPVFMSDVQAKNMVGQAELFCKMYLEDAQVTSHTRN